MAETDLRVLVVDDERSIRRFLKASLGSQFVILEATSGEEALSAVASEHPDIVILDLGLPDMDGVEVTRRLPRVEPGPHYHRLGARAGRGEDRRPGCRRG